MAVKQTAGRNILGGFAPKFAELNDDVLFGQVWSQILVCVAGRGYYQEWGKEPVLMVPGDTVNIPAGVKHWHGAAPDSWFSHLAVEVPGENTKAEWCEPVSDEEYAKMK